MMRKQPQLIGVELVTAGAPSKQVELSLLDAVLGVAARAVHALVQGFRRALQVGDDEAWIGAVDLVFEPCDDAALTAPTARRSRIHLSCAAWCPRSRTCGPAPITTRFIARPPTSFVKYPG